MGAVPFATNEYKLLARQWVLKHKGVDGTREISSLFREKSNVPQNLCFTNQLNKYRGTKRLVYDRLCNISLDPSCFPTLGSRGYFFLIDTDLIVPRRSRVNEARSAERKEREPYQTVAEALLNHKHGLFHIRYFENGPLEPG